MLLLIFLLLAYTLIYFSIIIIFNLFLVISSCFYTTLPSSVSIAFVLILYVPKKIFIVLYAALKLLCVICSSTCIYLSYKNLLSFFTLPVYFVPYCFVMHFTFISDIFFSNFCINLLDQLSVL